MCKINQTYPNSLREYRLKSGLKQIEVARALSMDCADRISRWENGKSTPCAVNLLKLEIIYKVPFGTLYQEMRGLIEAEILSPVIIPPITDSFA